jgi:hypothetical protein
MGAMGAVWTSVPVQGPGGPRGAGRSGRPGALNRSATRTDTRQPAVGRNGQCLELVIEQLWAAEQNGCEPQLKAPRNPAASIQAHAHLNGISGAPSNRERESRGRSASGLPFSTPLPACSRLLRRPVPIRDMCRLGRCGQDSAGRAQPAQRSLELGVGARHQHVPVRDH